MNQNLFTTSIAGDSKMEIGRTLLLSFGILQVLLGWLCCACGLKDVKSEEMNRSARRRRYVVFPEGSVLSAAFCLSPTAVTEAGGIFTSGVAWAISYDLPNETVHKRDEFPVSAHRHKRDIFVRMEKLMDTSGLNGRACVLRTICEARSQLIPRQNVLEEMLRLLFSYSPVNAGHSKRKVESYEKAHEAGDLGEDCGAMFPCPLSLLNLALQFGKH